MNSITSHLLAIAFVSITSFADAAASFVFIPARGLAAEPARAALVETLSFVLEKAEPGSRVLVLDPVDGNLRASFAVPPGTMRQRANDRSTAAGLAVLKKAFLESPAQRPWEQSAICLPQMLAALRSQVIAAGEGATVIFIGDPLHRTADGAFAFSDGAAPTTGWIFSSSEDSPFSVEAIGSLRDWRVHVIALPVAWAQSEWQEHTVTDFWRAYVHEAGGALVTVGDARLVMARVALNVGVSLPVPSVDRMDKTRLFVKKTFIRGQNKEVVQPAQAATLKPTITDLLIVDQTASMKPYITAVAQEVGALTINGERRYGLIFYSDYAGASESNTPAFFNSESADPSDIAKALRGVTLQSGTDIPEALSEALKLALDLVHDRKLGKIRISIFTDAPAKTIDASPVGSSDFRAMLEALVGEGHEVTLVACGDMKTDWVPNPQKIKIVRLK